MDHGTLDELSSHFQSVAATIAAGLTAGSPHVVGLVAKWDEADLVPGLSDLDFRVLCDDATTVDDWIEIDRLAGRIHLEMVRRHPEWNRINEHTPGAGLTIAETTNPRFHHPEYAVWSLWWGNREWFGSFQADVAARPFGAVDEAHHLDKFLHYYSPYIHGIDPPINLGPCEPKYALHSRCWHYFAPPVLSAASILARKSFSGKREGLGWLRDHGYIPGPVDAVLRQVDAHYETPEQTDPDRLRAFEELLFSGFEELYPLIVRSIAFLDIDRRAGPMELKRQVASLGHDPLAMLAEHVRYARIRAGRYLFYLNAPDHFDANRLIYYELPWIKKLSDPVVGSLRAALGEPTASLERCLGHLGLEAGRMERRAIALVQSLAGRSRDDPAVPDMFRQAIDMFPHYYRLIEQALGVVALQALSAPPAAVGEIRGTF